MAKISKAKSAQELKDEKAQKEQVSVIAEALQVALTPLQTAVTELQAEKAATASAEAVVEEAKRKADLDAAADVKAMLEDLEGVDDSDDKYDKLSNKQMIDVVCTAMESVMGATREQIKDELAEARKGGDEKMGRMERVMMGLVANEGVKAARAKYSDFDQFKEGIDAVISKNPTIDFEEAYFIAKSKAAGKVPPKRELETEKPQDYGSVPSNLAGGAQPGADAMAISAARGRSARSGTEVKSGIVAFRSAVSDAASKIASDMSSL